MNSVKKKFCNLFPLPSLLPLPISSFFMQFLCGESSERIHYRRDGVHEGGKNTATLVFIKVLFIINFPILFFCKKKNKISLKKNSSKKGFPVKLSKEVLLKGVP